MIRDGRGEHEDMATEGGMGTHASGEYRRWLVEDFGAAEHGVEGLARVTGAVGAAEVVECRSTAWPYPGPGWARSRTWRVDGGAGGGGGSVRP
jgi:hypothetical protein